MTWPMTDSTTIDTAGATASISRGTAVVGGVAHTKGSWTQLIAATTREAHGIIVHIDYAVNIGDYLIDLAIGGAGSEQIIAENLIASVMTGSSFNNAIYTIPIAAPAGVRLAARQQGSAASGTIHVVAHLIGPNFLTPSPLSLGTTYGANTADSGGTSIDPGATVNTKGAYSQIVASTTRPIVALLIGIGTQQNNARVNGNYLLDVAVGAASAEQVVLADLPFTAGGAEDGFGPSVLGPFFVDIPAGTRLAVRGAASITDATDRLFDVVLYGVG